MINIGENNMPHNKLYDTHVISVILSLSKYVAGHYLKHRIFISKI